jgi:hypothetical protein
MLDFSRPNFRNIHQAPSFIKIHPVGAEVLDAERQTDMTVLIYVFRNFAKGLQKHLELRIIYGDTCSSVHSLNATTLTVTESFIVINFVEMSTGNFDSFHLLLQKPQKIFQLFLSHV